MTNDTAEFLEWLGGELPVDILPESAPARTEQKQTLLDEYARRLRARDSTLDFVRVFFEDIYGARLIVGEHHRKLARILDQFILDIEAGQNPNLMVFLPPRSGKTSLLCSVLARLLGTHPNWDVVMASYNEDRGADMGRMVKRHLLNPLFQELFPECQLSKDSTSAVRSELTRGGAMTAAGVGTAVTGRGARCFLIDDPCKDSIEADSSLRQEEVWNWYGGVVNTRLAPEGAGQIIAMTRWNCNDLAGRLLQVAASDPAAPQWQVYSFPAIEGLESHPETERSFFPERFSLEWLRNKRSALRSVNHRLWSALYQQNPLPTEGVVCKAEWLKPLIVSEDSFPPLSATTNAITVDFAVTEGRGDYTAMYPIGFDARDVCWVRPDHFRKRADPKESLDALERMVRRYDPRYFFVEKGPLWNSLKSTLRDLFRRCRCYPNVVEVSRGKQKKIEVAMPYLNALQSGLVRFANTPHTHEILVPQHLSFGVGSHDDDVDALALPFVDRSRIMLPSEELALPPVEEQSFEQQRDAWIRGQSSEKPENEDENIDPYPLFAGDIHG